MTSKPRYRIAVLLACHNRRLTTLQCLTRLLSQASSEIDVEVFLVDDGSTDGTADAVRREFTAVHLIAGDGTLYWSGGMRTAFDAATNSGVAFTHFLWLNDDTLLVEDALCRLTAACAELEGQTGGNVLIVGSIVDPETGRPTYGGLRRIGILPFVRRLAPSKRHRRCHTMHGNCVLVPQAVAAVLGNIDSKLTHGRGDIDYGFRASQADVGVFACAGIMGTCTKNLIGAWRDPRLPLRRRLRALHEPKYALDEKVRVARRHYGLLWFLSPAAVYLYIFFSQPQGWLQRLFGRSDLGHASEGK